MEAGGLVFMVQQTTGSVLCCKCGVPMAPDAANMCTNCLRTEVEITENLEKQLYIMHCPECDHYLQPPKTWIKAQLESKELLTFCVKRLKNLNKYVRLVLEQAYMVEYFVKDHMCDSCSKVQANPDQWVASVQLGQHTAHMRTFFYLEQLILRHNAADVSGH